MNSNQTNQRLRETAWRRKLTATEQAELHAWLAANPDARADWEYEAALSELLTRLPNAPVPSNFSARVMQAVEREVAASERQHAPRRIWNWRVLVPRFALALLVAGAGLFGYQRYLVSQRIKLAQSVAAVADVRSLPSPQFLEDFDAICRLPPMPPADNDLIALMK